MSLLLPNDETIQSRKASADESLAEATRLLQRQGNESALISEFNTIADEVQRHHDARAYILEEQALEQLDAAYGRLVRIDSSAYIEPKSIRWYEIENKSETTQRYFRLTSLVGKDRRRQQAQQERPKLSRTAYFWKYGSVVDPDSYPYIKRQNRIDRFVLSVVAPTLLLVGAGIDSVFFNRALWTPYITVLAIGLLAFVLGYRKAVSWWLWAGLMLVSAAAVYGVANFLPILAFNAQSAHSYSFGFLGSRTVFLGRQLDFGLVLSAIYLYTLLVGTISLARRGADAHRLHEVTRWTLIVCLLLLWVILALIGSVINLGFGFGLGWWDITLLRGILPNLAIEFGVSSLIFIAAKKDPYSEG